MLSQKNYKRVVVKIGASLLAADKHKLNTALIHSLARQISDLVDEGKEVVLVSSGAIALGMIILKLANRPSQLQHLQATAAIGQHELMHVYKLALSSHNLNCAQLLLTWEDFSDRRYLNAKNTLHTLLQLKCVPIINENDTVATEEIKFGDNDKLSAMVSILVDADLLIILSDVDGLWDKNKKIIRKIPLITQKIKSLACPTNKKSCVGGMITKIEAARIAVNAGVPCVIANGHKQGIITQVVRDPLSKGSIFLPHKKKGFARGQ